MCIRDRFLTFQSTIPEVFETFYRQLFEKWSKNHRKIWFFSNYWMIRFFTGNPALQRHFIYQYLTSDQKLEKFMRRKYDNWKVDTLSRISAVGSPLVRTVTSFLGLVSTSETSSRFKKIDYYHIMKYQASLTTKNQTIIKKSKIAIFWPFQSTITLILHNFASKAGYLWLSTSQEPLGLSYTAIASLLKPWKSKNWSKI